MTCWHKWTQWKDTANGRMVVTAKFGSDPTIDRGGSKWIEQERRCEKCGAVQLRTATA